MSRYVFGQQVAIKSDGPEPWLVGHVTGLGPGETLDRAIYTVQGDGWEVTGCSEDDLFATYVAPEHPASIRNAERLRAEARARRRRWLVHNLIVHPLLVLCPPVGEWLHDRTSPEGDR